MEDRDKAATEKKPAVSKSLGPVTVASAPLAPVVAPGVRRKPLMSDEAWADLIDDPPPRPPRNPPQTFRVPRIDLPRLPAPIALGLAAGVVVLVLIVGADLLGFRPVPASPPAAPAGNTAKSTVIESGQAPVANPSPAPVQPVQPPAAKPTAPTITQFLPDTLTSAPAKPQHDWQDKPPERPKRVLMASQVCVDGRLVHVKQDNVYYLGCRLRPEALRALAEPAFETSWERVPQCAAPFEVVSAFEKGKQVHSLACPAR